MSLIHSLSMFLTYEKVFVKRGQYFFRQFLEFRAYLLPACQSEIIYKTSNICLLKNHANIVKILVGQKKIMRAIKGNKLRSVYRKWVIEEMPLLKLLLFFPEVGIYQCPIYSSLMLKGRGGGFYFFFFFYLFYFPLLPT